MFSFDLSPMNIFFTVAVVLLFGGFVTLLLKLKPSTETEERQAHAEAEDKTPEQPAMSSSIPLASSSLKADASATPERLVIVGATVGGTSIPTMPETPPPVVPKKEDHARPQKTVASTKDNSSPAKRDCIHHFGYLRTSPRNSPIPDECFGCERIVDCLVAKSPVKEKK